MFSYRAVITFIVIFILLGSLGALFDLLTGGSYRIRVTLVEGGKYASKKVRVWVNLLVKGWVWSPLFALAILLSPILFTLVLLVYIFDSYRQYQVYYDDDTLERFVYPRNPITESTIKKAGGSIGWMKTFFGPSLSGIVYMGEPLPKSFILLSAASEATVKLAKSKGWEIISISGIEFLAPKLGVYPPDDVDEDEGLVERQ